MKREIGVAEDRLEIDEIMVVGAMAIGTMFWVVASIITLASGQMPAFYTCAVLAILTAGAAVLGWYLQRVAAASLTVAAIGLVAWGILASWGLGVWMFIGGILIAPMLAVAGMLEFADYEERVVERGGHSGPWHAVRA